MEDYLYEKKKKFEMMKNRNKVKPSQNNNVNNIKNMNNINNNKERKSSTQTPIQLSQYEKNILKNYEFKTKNNELASMKQKILSKQRLSIEKNLKINNNVFDRNSSTNTICLQGEEFNFFDFYGNNNATTNSLKSRNESNLTAINSNLEDIEDMTFSKQNSKLNFQNNLQYNKSSKIEIASQDNLNDSSNNLNKKKKKDKSSKIKKEPIDGSMKKKKNSNSISSLSRKSSNKNEKKKINSNSIIQNSEDELNNSTNFSGSYSTIANSRSTSISNTNLSSTSEMKSSKGGIKKILKSLSRSSSRSKVDKINNSSSDGKEKNDDEDVHKSEESLSSITSKLFSKRNFSFGSLRLKKSKSNISVSNSEHQSVNSITTSGESKPLSRRNSFARSVIRKISSISKLASFKSNDEIKSSPPPNTDSILSNEKKGLLVGNFISIFYFLFFIFFFFLKKELFYHYQKVIYIYIV